VAGQFFALGDQHHRDAAFFAKVTDGLGTLADIHGVPNHSSQEAQLTADFSGVFQAFSKKRRVSGTAEQLPTALKCGTVFSE
jgi:hypothetical protein